MNIDTSHFTFVVPGTTNYAVFPTIYYGYSGSGGTCNAADSSTAMKPIVITSITSTGFSYVFEKTAGNNPPSSYPTMMPSVSSVPTSAPYQIVIPCDCSVNNTFIVLASVSGAINALTAITIFVLLCCTRQIAFLFSNTNVVIWGNGFLVYLSKFVGMLIGTISLRCIRMKTMLNFGSSIKKDSMLKEDLRSAPTDPHFAPFIPHTISHPNSDIVPTSKCTPNLNTK